MAAKNTPAKSSAKKAVKKAAAKAVKKAASSEATSKPAFPYTTKPNSIRKFLEQVPQRPRPTKVVADTLRAWDLKDTNDQTIIRVFKSLGFLGSNNEPTDRYTEYMTPGRGPKVLAQAIKEVWAPLFELSHEPHRADELTLRNYFNIHSGGSPATISYQMQTFKAACDFADFTSPGSIPVSGGAILPAGPAFASQSVSAGQGPVIHIDLHIHLPENKSRRDYEYIFEDIAKYILGRPVDGAFDE